MKTSILVMGVTQVMGRVDQWLVEATQCMDQVEQLICRPCVETEMQMEDVELAVMIGDPSCVEGRRRPPLRRWDARPDDRIGQSHDAVQVAGHLKVTDIDVAGGD